MSFCCPWAKHMLITKVSSKYTFENWICIEVTMCRVDSTQNIPYGTYTEINCISHIMHIGPIKIPYGTYTEINCVTHIMPTSVPHVNPFRAHMGPMVYPFGLAHMGPTQIPFAKPTSNPYGLPILVPHVNPYRAHMGPIANC